MTRIAIEDLIGPDLDWAVAQAEGIEVVQPKGWFNGAQVHLARAFPYGPPSYEPSRLWSLAGPIIEAERISVFREAFDDWWTATLDIEVGNCWHVSDPSQGETALIAAMRCHVRNKLGEFVEVPSRLEAA